MKKEDKPEKKKWFRADLILLIILLIVAVIVVYFFLQNPFVIGDCNTDADCGRYNVLYIKGNGYVCANNIVTIDSSIKTKILMFKYASKKAILEEPTSCSCIENQCEMN